MTLVAVATVVQRIIVQLLGPGNAAGRWLAAHAAMTWVRAPDGMMFAGGPLLPFSFSFSSSFPNRPGRRVVARQRKQERRLSTAETHQLIDRIAEAALAVESEHPHLRLTYRAAGGYEEIVLAGATTRFGPWSDRLLPEPDGAPEPAVEWELPEFPARTALRRLREAAYRAGYGTPFTLHVTVNRPAHREAAPDHRHWREAVWEETVAGAPRPEWRRPPRPTEYAADLRRFPAARRMVPLWLRQELGWRWLLPLWKGAPPTGGPDPAAEPAPKEPSGSGGPAAPSGGAAPVSP